MPLTWTLISDTNPHPALTIDLNHDHDSCPKPDPDPDLCDREELLEISQSQTLLVKRSEHASLVGGGQWKGGEGGG